MRSDSFAVLWRANYMVREEIEKLRKAAAAVSPILERLNRGESLAKIRKRIDDVEGAEIKVLVCGEFKRGKSSFVNALIGRAVCPVDQDICTSVVSVIRYGERERVTRYFGDLSHIRSEEVLFSEIGRYTVGRAADVRNTLYLEVELPLERLKAGLTLIDTPGVGGLDPRHAFLTTYFLPQADITLFMTDVNEPLTTTELDFYNQKVSRYARHSAVVVNKCDLKTPEQVEEVRRDTERKLREHAAGGGALNVVAVSSKMMLAYNQTRVERMYEKSRFAQVDAELGRLMEAYREDLARGARDELSDLLAQTAGPMKVQLEQIRMPDPKRIMELKRREEETQKQLRDLNDPSSSFRTRIQQKITEVREQVINHLNEQSILFSSNGLNSLLQSREATEDDGGVWIGRQLNTALESLGAEIVLELRRAFEQVAGMEEFQGMLHYQVRDFSYRIAEVNAERKVPLHKRFLSLMPGVGAGLALGGVAAMFGFALPLVAPIALGLGLAAKSHSDTVRATKLSELREQYQPQLTVAMQQLRTFVETRFSEFQQEWIRVVAQRVQEEQTTLKGLMADLNKLSQDQKTALARKMELERMVNPLVAQKHVVDLVLATPFGQGGEKAGREKEAERPDPNETIG